MFLVFSESVKHFKSRFMQISWESIENSKLIRKIFWIFSYANRLKIIYTQSEWIGINPDQVFNQN